MRYSNERLRLRRYHLRRGFHYGPLQILPEKEAVHHILSPRTAHRQVQIQEREDRQDTAQAELLQILQIHGHG